MTKPKRFTLRVYGVLFNKGKLLLSHESYQGKSFTKFPGGGLNLGESVLEGLVREFKEEMSIDIEPSYLFHITESLQISAFHPDEQVLAIYYLVQSDQVDQIPTGRKKEELKGTKEVFEWVSINHFDKAILTFESDREAASKLLDKQALKF